MEKGPPPLPTKNVQPTVSGGPPPPPLTNIGASDKPKKWAVVEDINHNEWSLDKNWKFNPKFSISDIKTVNWDKALGCKISENGSSGVFFIEIEKEGYIVIKGCSTVAADMLSNKLSKKLNISAPNIRFSCYLDENWDKMVQPLWKLEETNNNQGRGSKLAKCLYRPFLVIMQFVIGESLNQENSKNLLNDQTLFELGKILAFDIIINNSDRLPTIFDNEGNLDNLLISENKIWAIDSTITSIDPKFDQQFDIYFKKVDDLVKHLIESKNEKEIQEIEKIRNFLIDKVGYNIETEGSLIIQKGLLQCFTDFSQITITEIESMKKKIEEKLRPTASMLGLDESLLGLNLIHKEFLSTVLTAIKKLIPE